MADETPYIVTATATIMSGLVVRWYCGAGAAVEGECQVSASRDGVLVDGFLHLVPVSILVKAQEVHAILARRGDETGVRALATHRWRGRVLERIAASPLDEGSAP